MAMIRGQEFWVCVFMLCASLSEFIGSLWRAHAAFGSDLSLVLIAGVLFDLVIALGCVRIQRSLGSLQGKVDGKILSTISQSVYLVVMFAFLGFMDLMAIRHSR
jgi:hypothetical protein